MSPSPHYILNSDDLSVLESQGTAQRLDGHVRIRKWLTYSTRLTTSPSSDDEDNVWVTLPSKLYSRETYEYLGLNPVKAGMLWDRWNNLEPQSKNLDYHSEDRWVVPEHTFLWYAVQHICEQAEIHDPATLLDDWHGTMREWGVKEDLIERIMDPEFTQMRLMSSAKWNMIETMQGCYSVVSDAKRFKSLEILREGCRLDGTLRIKKRMNYFPGIFKDDGTIGTIDLTAKIPYSTQLLVDPITRADNDDIRGMASWERIDHRHVYTVGEKYESGVGGEDSDGFEVGVQLVLPMSFAGDSTELMEEIYAQCKDIFQVCQLQEVDIVGGQ